MAACARVGVLGRHSLAVSSPCSTRRASPQGSCHCCNGCSSGCRREGSPRGEGGGRGVVGSARAVPRAQCGVTPCCPCKRGPLGRPCPVPHSLMCITHFTCVLVVWAAGCGGGGFAGRCCGRRAFRLLPLTLTPPPPSLQTAGHRRRRGHSRAQPVGGYSHAHRLRERGRAAGGQGLATTLVLPRPFCADKPCLECVHTPRCRFCWPMARTPTQRTAWGGHP